MFRKISPLGMLFFLLSSFAMAQTKKIVLFPPHRRNIILIGWVALGFLFFAIGMWYRARKKMKKKLLDPLVEDPHILEQAEKEIQHSETLIQIQSFSTLDGYNQAQIIDWTLRLGEAGFSASYEIYPANLDAAGSTFAIRVPVDQVLEAKKLLQQLVTR